MILSRRLLLTVLVLLLPVCHLAGSPPVAAQEKVKLDLWIFEGEEQLLPALEQGFEAAHPDIDLEITLVPEDQYVVKVDTAMAAGSPPDLGFLYDRRWVKAGQVLPLDDMIAADHIDLQDLNPAIVQGLCTVDGKVYCLGSYIGAMVMFYNKDMFDAAGLPYPAATEPLTVDEYADLAAKLTVPNDDVTQTVWGGVAYAPYSWMSRGDFISPDGRTVEGLINDDPTKHAYDVLANMIIQGSSPSESLMQSMGMDGSADLFLQGKIAMSLGDFADITTLEESGINYGVATLPVEKAGDAPYLPMWTDGFSVFSGGKHPEEAKEFIAYLATEGQRLRVEVTGQAPLSAKAAEEYHWADQGNSESRHQFLEVAATGSPLTFVPGFEDVVSPLSDVFHQVSGGEVSASDALDEVAPRMQESLDQAWVTWESFGN